MLRINEVVKASSIWETAKDFIDEGKKDGLVRGYNIEVYRAKDDATFWMSCVYIYSDIEHYVNSNENYYGYYLDDMGVVPTGRICFRGYGVEEYSFEFKDTFIVDCDSNGNVIRA